MRRWLTSLGDLPYAALRSALLRRAVGLFGLLLVASTWRLWTPQTVFPQVPMFAWAVATGAWCHWLAAAGMIAGLVGMLLAPGGRAAQVALWLFAAATVAMFVLDQQRMQPWAYQFVLLAIVLAASPPRPGLTLLRLFIASFYLYSAITKLDYSFLHTLGQQFLAALFGSGVETWSPSLRLGLAAMFPVGELLVAVGLLFARTRLAALAGSVVLHALLLVILGPWGLDHQPGVLVWNVYFIVQNLLLFGGRRAPGEVSAEEPPQRIPWPVLAVMLAAMTLPLLEPTAWFDIWPSWGLYASSAERVVFQVHRLERDKVPAALQKFVDEPEEPADPWLIVRLDSWALDALAAPIYPQNRVQLGVAEALADRAQLAHRARVIRFELAGRFTGERPYTVLQGPAQFEAAAGEYFLNSTPANNLRE